MSGPVPPGSALTHSEALARLERSERGLRQVVEAAPHATLLIAYDGTIVFANPAVEELLGHPHADLPGTSVEELIAPRSRSAHRARREALAAESPTGPISVVRGARALTRAGREVPVEIALGGVETAAGPLLSATLRDISADLLQERQDSALRRIAGAAGPDMAVERLLAMLVEEAASLLGAEKALVGRFDPDRVVIVGSHGDHLTKVGDVIPAASGASLVAVSRTGETARLVYDDLPAGDPIRELALSQDHHEAVAVPITVHTRLWGGLMVAARDAIPVDAAAALTRFAEFAGALIGAAQSRATERALRDSEERFRLLADFIPQLLWTAGPDGECDFINQRWVEYTGIPAEEQLGRRLLDRVHPDDRADVRAAWEAVMDDGSTFAAEFRLRRHDGVYRRFDARGAAMRDDTGAIVKWFGSNTDVEDARVASEAVRASEAQLRAALDAGRMGAWTLDVAGGSLRVDDNVRTIFEIPDDVPESAVRKMIADRIHPRDLETIGVSIARAMEGSSPEHRDEYRIVLPDGRIRWIETRGRVTRGADGVARTVTGVLVNTTEARQAGERLLRSQKLEALGTLAGGIAHDFNNLLQVIGGNVAIARSELPEDHATQDQLGAVERTTQRAADLVGRILAFSRPDEGSTDASIALGPVIEEAIDLLRPTLPAMIELRQAFDGDLPPVSADPGGVTQIITNLAGNAAQAIGRHSGLIEFRLEKVVLDADELAGSPELTEGAYVRLTVSDDGPGMDAGTLTRIFDPFFTTKAPGEGTGLGLSIVHSLMRAHGGSITVYSVPGVGTAFRLYFPVAAEAPAGEGPSGQAQAQASAHGSPAGRILFVDDEPDLVALHERSLGRVGHVVTGLTDPREALERFLSDPAGFDAVVTDLSMPGMTGLELAAAILAERPGIPILIVSGYIPPDERAEAEALGVRDILPKPSPIARLREALAGALGG